MKKKQMGAMLLAVTLLVQSLGINVYAAEVPKTSRESLTREISLTEDIAEDGNVTLEAETTTDFVVEDVILDEAYDGGEIQEGALGAAESVFPAEEVQAAEPAVLEETGEGEELEGNYLVDETMGITLKNVQAEPESYHVNLSWISQESGYVTSTIGLLYTQQKAAGENFYPDVTYVAESETFENGYVYNECNYTSEWLSYGDEGYVMGYSNYRCKGQFSSGDLKPDNTYYWRVVCRVYDSQVQGYVYKFLTKPQKFTTKAAVTATQVSIEEAVVEETGYAGAKVVFSIKNPGKEYIQEKYVCLAAENEEYSSSRYPVYQYQDENHQDVENKYYVHVPLNASKIRAKVFVKVFTGDREETLMESQEMSINRKTLTPEMVTCNVWAGTKTLRVDIKMNPYHEEDLHTLFYNFYYRVKGENAGWLHQGSNIHDEYISYMANILQADTEYEYYLEIGNTDTVLYSMGTEEEPKTIKTQKDITYQDSDFPDAVLREKIRSKINVGAEDPITSSKLEAVTEIDLSCHNEDKEIRSIEGVQYLTNLRVLRLDGQGITDVSCVKGLKNLVSLSIGDNNLEEMPDLSGLEMLETLDLDCNFMEESSFTEEKLPKVFLKNNDSWIANTVKTQLGAEVYDMPSAFYAIKETYPFFIKLNHCKENRTYTLSLTIEGHTVSVTSFYSYAGDKLFLIPDLQKTEDGTESGIQISPGEYTAVLNVVDQTGRKYIENETIALNIKADLPAVSEIESMGTAKTECDIDVYLPENVQSEEIEKIEVLDRNGKLLGKGSVSDWGYPGSEEERYHGYSVGSKLTWGHWIRTFDLRFAKYPEVGDYDIRVTMKDETVYVMEDAVHITQNPVVTRVYEEIDYDQRGEYAYISIDGFNLDKIKPVLYRSGKPVTEYVEQILFDRSHYGTPTYTYKLKKLDPSSWLDSWIYDVKYETTEGVIPEIQEIANECEFSNAQYDAVLFAHYNYKKQVYEVFFDSSVPEGTQISATVCDNYEYVNEVAYGTGILHDKRLALTFKTADGSDYTVPKDVIFVKYEFTVDGEQIKCRDACYDIWYNYSNSWVDSQELTAADEILQVQEGAVKERQDGTNAAADDSKFYLENQDVSWDYQGRVYLRISSKQLYEEWNNKYKGYVTKEEALKIWKNKYNVEIFDLVGNPVTGWKMDSAFCYMNYLEVYLTGLPEEYAGFYFRVTDKEGNPGINPNSGQSYYEGDSYSVPELGKWSDLNFRELYIGNGDDSLHGIYSLQGYPSLYPVTATFVRPYDLTVIKQFTINSKNPAYEFTKADLQGIKEDEIYTLILQGGKDTFAHRTGYFTVRNSSSTVINPTGVTLDKSKMNLQLGEKRQLTAEVKPSNATDSTLTWSSNNESVALVSASGEVSAVGVGNAVITAVTHNDRKAQCEVTVFSYSISREEAVLDLSGEGQSLLLTISDGTQILSGITWSSQDEAVAAVDRNGKVSAKGVGETLIVGSVKNGPALSCKIKVERSVLEKISLSPEKLELERGETGKAAVFYTPADVTCDKTLYWSSSDPAVASVDAEGVITAAGKGTAVITAKVKDTLIQAQCTVKVWEKAEEETLTVPTGLTALVNEQKNLGEVSLEKFEGWHWLAPETELAAFSGRQEKEFTAYYQQNEDTKPVYRQVKVRLCSLKGISLEGGETRLCTGESTEVKVVWNLNGSGYDMSSHDILWKNEKDTVASLSGEGDHVTVTAKGKGKTTVEASVVSGGKTYKAKLSLTVAEGKRAGIRVEEVTGMTARTVSENDIYEGNKASL